MLCLQWINYCYSVSQVVNNFCCDSGMYIYLSEIIPHFCPLVRVGLLQISGLVLLIVLIVKLLSNQWINHKCNDRNKFFLDRG